MSDLLNEDLPRYDYTCKVDLYPYTKGSRLCGKPALVLRFYNEGADYFPLCAYHARVMADHVAWWNREVGFPKLEPWGTLRAVGGGEREQPNGKLSGETPPPAP